MNWMDRVRRLIERARGESPAGDGPPPATCHEALNHLHEWLDGELPPEEEARIGEHLEICARCYPRLRFEEAFREMLERAGGSGTAEAPADTRSRVLARLREEGMDDDQP